MDRAGIVSLIIFTTDSSISQLSAPLKIEFAENYITRTGFLIYRAVFSGNITGVGVFNE
jgi:hypothetical protein